MLKFLFILPLSFCLGLFAYTSGYAADSSNQAGQKIYKANCTICHSKTMASMMKAPTMQTMVDWKPFIIAAIQAATQKKTTACSSLTQSVSDTSTLKVTDSDLQKLTTQQKACYLLPNAKAGVTKAGAIMPPKGNCVSCTDQQLLSGIEYMLSTGTAN